ncbi:MAG: response regulator [Magnetococcales bacterium]|nr:response regulator [Magnetococcales bacterium]
MRTDSIAVHLLFRVFTLYVLVAGFLTVAQMAVGYFSAQESIKEDLRSFHETFIPPLTEAYWEADIIQISAILEGLMKIPTIKGVVLRDRNGPIFKQMGRVPEQDERSQREQEGLSTFFRVKEGVETLFGYEHPLVYIKDGKQFTIGSLSIISSSRQVFDRVKDGFLVILINSLIKTAVLWILFIWLGRRYLTAPLNALARSIRQIQPALSNDPASGTLLELSQSLSLPQAPQYELQHLMTGIDALIREISSYKHRMHKSQERLLLETQSLRTRVDLGLERLRLANDRLNQEVIQRRSAQENAEKASEEKTRFLATMSHEIRTPLSGIISLLPQIDTSGFTTEQQRHFEILQQSSQFLHEIVEEVLDISMIESGSLELNPSLFSLRSMLKSIDQLFHWRMEAKGLTFTMKIGQNVPDLLYCDSVRLKRILHNLLSNAQKFTIKGGVIFRVNIIRHEDKHVRLRFSVRDSGIGIESGKQSELFEPFHQLDQGMTRHFGGVGLGLAISQALVTLFNARLSIASLPDAGSLFRLYITVRKVSGPDEKHENRINPPKRSEHRVRSVLLVEDDLITQEVIGTLIATNGAACDSAGNAYQALCYLARREYDLVLMDLHLPGLDGLTAAGFIQSITEQCEHALPRIVMLSADVMRENLVATKAAGIDAFLPKPVDVESLKTVLQGGFTNGLTSPVSTISENDSVMNDRNLPLFDHADLIKRRGDQNPERWQRFVEMLVDQWKPQLTDMVEHSSRRPFLEEERALLAADVHKLLGVALHFSLVRLAEHARAFEQTLRDPDASCEPGAVMDQLVKEFDDSLQALCDTLNITLPDDRNH